MSSVRGRLGCRWFALSGKAFGKWEAALLKDIDSWLREEGIYEETTSVAIKRVLARQVEAAMKEKIFSKAEMAKRMHTSRAALDRLLDPQNGAVTLSTFAKSGVRVGPGNPFEHGQIGAGPEFQVAEGMEPSADRTTW